VWDNKTWRSCDRASLMYSFKYNQQDATLYNILYYCQCCTCFGRFFRQACLVQPLALAPSKPGTYPILCVQFLSSWWWAEKAPETCRALTIIKNIVKRCILLVILKGTKLGCSTSNCYKRNHNFLPFLVSEHLYAQRNCSTVYTFGIFRFAIAFVQIRSKLET